MTPNEQNIMKDCSMGFDLGENLAAKLDTLSVLTTQNLERYYVVFWEYQES